ncbi:MAG: SusE domain-containing protein [Ferruginibacter sp.]|nr:SusE domain-containing protein [Ferruginibacter sp.]
MKSIFNIITAACLTLAFAACNKVDDLPFYKTGTSATLAASTTTIAPKVADSNSVALTLNWTLPDHSTDTNRIKYVVEIDSTGRNFSASYRKTEVGKLTTSFLAKELNAILLGMGFAYDKAYDMDIRVISSYNNNNERLASNTVKVNIKTYKVPPKVLPPATKTLYLVGNATAGGWDNPVSAAQQFTMIDSVTYEGTFYLNGGKQFLLLPLNGNWDNKYSVANNAVPGLNAGGAFGLNLSENFPGPAKTGTYKVRVDFQRGLFTVTPVKMYDLFYLPGDYQGWNPGNAPALGSPATDGKYETYVNFPAGGTYKFKLASQPDWNGTNYGDGGAGTLSTSGGDLSVPSAGYYKINANITDKTWLATKTTWGMIGEFNGWSGDAAMTYNADANAWIGNIVAPANGVFKFRANGGWTLNYGDNGKDGSLEEGGADIQITAGPHEVRLYLGNAGYYTYRIN